MQLTLFSSIVGFPHFLLLFVPKPLMAEVVDSCFVEQRPQGTTYFLKESVEPCDYYNWVVDGTVMANEERFNSSVVHSRGPRNMTLLSCHDKVSYRNSCSGTPKNCSTTCLIALPPKEDTSTDDGIRQPHSSVNRPAVIGGCVAGLAGLALLCALVVLVFRFLQPKREARCTSLYILASQVVVL